jgi:hypothetical protein
MKKLVILITLSAFIFGCAQQSDSEMYEASEMASLMRDFVEFSKDAKKRIAAGDQLEVPQAFYSLKSKQATRNEQDDQEFQQMADLFLVQLKALDGADSTAAQAYHSTIDACVTCHSTYCGGPLEIINKLYID